MRAEVHRSFRLLKLILRIPISPDRPIEDNYLDAYLRVIQETDPDRSALVFSCGLGAVRTTFGMVAAIIIRQKQRLLALNAGPTRLASCDSVDRVLTPSSSRDSNAVRLEFARPGKGNENFLL